MQEYIFFFLRFCLTNIYFFFIIKLLKIDLKYVFQTHP